MTLTRLLAELAIETPAEALPESARAAARKMMLDTFACAIAGVGQPGCDEALALVAEWGGAPQAGVIGTPERLPVAHAAFANSVLVHALDYDDLYQPGSLHLTSVVVPAALAVAEWKDISADAFLAAFVLGAEVAGRLSRAGAKRRRGVGFLPTSVEGIFGATAAASRLLGLDVAQTTHALGMAYAQCCGNRQALMDMTLTKRLQPAFAARDAVWAACLAEKGLTGPHRALEGEAGLFGVYLHNDVPAAEELSTRTGEWQIEQLSVKRYTSCGGSHSLMDLAVEMTREHNIDPARIEMAEISFGGSAKNAVVGYPFVPGDNPQVAAQFSAPYCVAVALVHGDAGLERFTDSAIKADEQARALAGRVEMVDLDAPPPAVPVPEGFAPYAGKCHTLRVHMMDGRVLEGHRAPVETFDPARTGESEVVAKYNACVDFSKWLAPDQAAALRDEVVAGGGSPGRWMERLARDISHRPQSAFDSVARY